MDQNPYAAPSLNADLASTKAGVPATALPWFAVGTRKLLVMSILTLGLYVIHWFERQYRFQKRTWGESSWPLARGLLAVFYAHELFRRVERAAKAVEIRPSWTSSAMGALFVASAITGRVLDRISGASAARAVGILSFVTLVGLAYPVYRVQRTVNELLAREFADFERNERFTVWNWLAAAVGALALVLAIVGMLLPAS